MQQVEGNAEWTTCDSSSRQTVHTISKTLYVTTISCAYVEIERAHTCTHSLIIQQLSLHNRLPAPHGSKKTPKVSDGSAGIHRHERGLQHLGK